MQFNYVRTVEGTSGPPFTIVNRRKNAERNGNFTPGAEVAFGPGSAASGLFATLKPTDLQTLVATLSIVSSNGHIRPTCHQVSAALGIHPVRALYRLTRLTMIKWRGKPMLVRIGNWGGIVTYIPSAEIVGQRLGPLEQRISEPDNIIYGAGRDRVVQASREKYARRRGDVERELTEAHGWPFQEEFQIYAEHTREREPNLEGDDRHARQRLVRLGVDSRTADSLVRRFGRDRIARQVAYLPFRKAKDKTKLLISSIEGDYEIPQSLAEMSD